MASEPVESVYPATMMLFFGYFFNTRSNPLSVSTDAADKAALLVSNKISFFSVMTRRMVLPLASFTFSTSAISASSLACLS